jgi:hypothetical protein
MRYREGQTEGKLSNINEKSKELIKDFNFFLNE